MDWPVIVFLAFLLSNLLSRWFGKVAGYREGFECGRRYERLYGKESKFKP